MHQFIEPLLSSGNTPMFSPYPPNINLINNMQMPQVMQPNQMQNTQIQNNNQTNNNSTTRTAAPQKNTSEDGSKPIFLIKFNF